MIKRKNIIKIAIDSPAAAGAGTIAKAISNHYNLLQVDTGKIYRLIALYKNKHPKKFTLNFLKKKINKLKVKDLDNNELLSDNIGSAAALIAKKKSIRKLVYNFQKNLAYNPPKNFEGQLIAFSDFGLLTKISAFFSPLYVFTFLNTIFTPIFFKI